MQHPYYPSPDKFVPDSASIDAWLKTRKNNSENKPGIFETVDYNRDRNWSIASILIELAAFYFTFIGAFSTYKKNGDIKLVIIALVVVLLFVIFDVIGIMLHGQDKPNKTLNRSLYLVTTNPAQKAIIYEALKETTWREFLGFMLLSISAVMKILALWYFFQMSSIQILVIFTILYVLVIYIHSVHTVFWWPARKLKKSIKKQSEKFEEYFSKKLPTNPANTISSMNHYSFSFDSKCVLNESVIETCSEGRINVVSNGNGNFTLNAKGPIWDENIVHLASQWDQQYVTDLIHACITVQLLQNNVIVNGSAPNSIVSNAQNNQSVN
jgi:hypothetical protein